MIAIVPQRESATAIVSRVTTCDARVNMHPIQMRKKSESSKSSAKNPTYAVFVSRPVRQPRQEEDPGPSELTSRSAPMTRVPMRLYNTASLAMEVAKKPC